MLSKGNTRKRRVFILGVFLHIINIHVNYLLKKLDSKYRGFEAKEKRGFIKIVAKIYHKWKGI